MKMYTF